jgi:hypothetical protein
MAFGLNNCGRYKYFFLGEYMLFLISLENFGFLDDFESIYSIVFEHAYEYNFSIVSFANNSECFEIIKRCTFVVYFFHNNTIYSL